MHFDASFEALVRNSFAAALAAGQPDRITRSAYAALDQQPTAVIALGKAAGAMAAAVRDGGYDGSGLVITTDENHRQIDGFDCFARVPSISLSVGTLRQYKRSILKSISFF